MTDALARARADLDAGRPWKARDRLTGLLAVRQDPELLDLLAAVHFSMSDLPAAGALWFITGRDDPDALLAVAAWRERFGNDEARWQSLPRVVRSNATDRALRDLRRSARNVQEERSARHRAEWRQADRQAQPSSVSETAIVWALIGLLISLVALILIGAGTVIGWF